MKPPKQIIHGLDHVTLLCVVLLVCIGLVTVFSSAHRSGLGEVKPYFSRQLVWALLGLAVMMFAILIDYRYMASFSYYAYALLILLLIALFVLNKEVKGAQRWIRVFGFQMQPSEAIKAATLFALARYLDQVRERIRQFRFLALGIAIAGIPAVLIVLQPDLGTGLVLIALLGGMLFAAGASKRHLLAIGLCGVVMAPIFWSFLKDYQRARLLSFVNPNLDPLGASYQVIQSKIAVGAGGLFGKGWLGGTQSQLNFLPEQHTDFIFSVFAEQWGFIGSIILVTLYFLLLWQATKIAGSARDYLGSLLAFGVVTILAFQVLVNLLMTVGLMPVTGIPLPFMSYGGSNLLTMMACAGLLLGIEARSRMF